MFPPPGPAELKGQALPVERAVHPAGGRRPLGLAGSVRRLRPRLRTPERRLGSVEARRGPHYPASGRPQVETTPRLQAPSALWTRATAGRSTGTSSPRGSRS